MFFFHQTKHFLNELFRDSLEPHGRDAEKKDKITIGDMNKDDHNSVGTLRRACLAYVSTSLAVPLLLCASLTAPQPCLSLLVWTCCFYDVITHIVSLCRA